jgi:hypothetical protein
VTTTDRDERILSTLAGLVADEQTTKREHKDAKTRLDAFIVAIMALPRGSRPGATAMAAIVGVDRRRLYQIRHDE